MGIFCSNAKKSKIWTRHFAFILLVGLRLTKLKMSCLYDCYISKAGKIKPMANSISKQNKIGTLLDDRTTKLFVKNL